MILAPTEYLHIIINSFFCVHIYALEVVEHVLNDIRMRQEQSNNQSRDSLAKDLNLALPVFYFLPLLVDVPEAEAADEGDEGEDRHHEQFLEKDAGALEGLALGAAVQEAVEAQDLGGGLGYGLGCGEEVEDALGPVELEGGGQEDQLGVVHQDFQEDTSNIILLPGT